MLNLDTVGRLENKKLLVIGAGSAREWVHIFRGAGYVTGVELETVVAQLDSSDQKSFQEVGVPAVQLFTGPHPDYHRPTDTVDKIDPEGLVKVASVAKETLEYLAGRQGPLTSTSAAGQSLVDPSPKRGRKVSLGTMPDFSFQGEGYRLDGVVPGSPAASAGLMKGDVIVRIGNKDVRSLRDVSTILKSLKPGDRVAITFIRTGKEMTVETEVVPR
jgi:membrane-associated protease RseP (regulator of RpoE activity)